MNVIRIALSGKMRSGKDTVASCLVERHGFVRVAFGDRVKELAKDLFHVSETNKNRALLQMLGWRMCQIDDAVWVKCVLDKIPFDRDVVVSDLRFPIEYYALKGLGFYMFRVDIDPEEQRRRVMVVDPKMPKELLDDPSETALDGGWRWDRRLDGGADLCDLYEEIDSILRELRRQKNGESK